MSSRLKQPPHRLGSKGHRNRKAQPHRNLLPLSFGTGKKEQIHNYAIVGKTLWVFNERQARKILLSELDIPATRKANEERGVEFSIPQ